MADESNVNPVTTEPPLPNDPASRTSDGQIKDQSQTQLKATPNEPDPKPAAEPTPKPTAPDSYTFKAPEGRELDKSVIDRATPIFRELGLSQDAAQKLVDTYNELAESRDNAGKKLVDDMRSGWRTEVSKDPDMGGKLDAVKADIGRMKNVIFGNDTNARKAFDEAMDLTGAGDHPAIVKAWYKASQRFTEGTHVSGTAPSTHGQVPSGRTERPSLAAAMYPNLPH